MPSILYNSKFSPRYISVISFILGPLYTRTFTPTSLNIFFDRSAASDHFFVGHQLKLYCFLPTHYKSKVNPEKNPVGLYNLPLQNLNLSPIISFVVAKLSSQLDDPLRESKNAFWPSS